MISTEIWRLIRGWEAVGTGKAAAPDRIAMSQTLESVQRVSGPTFCNCRRTMITISRDFAEKARNRESQPLSGADRPVLSLVRATSPTAENGKVAPPRRVANRERRTREHLTPQEVEKLIRAASRAGRYGHRDATLILLAYRHGLRVSELGRCAGTRSTSSKGYSPSRGSRTECRRLIRCADRRYGRFGDYGASIR